MAATDILGPTMGTAFAAMTGIMILALVIFYVYYSLVWMTIAKKLNYNKGWLAWIPVANISLILTLGGFHWAWVFLILIPILGWIALGIMTIIATWRVFEKRKYPGWLALLPIGSAIPYIGVLFSLGFAVAIGLAAWKDQ